MVTPHCIAHSQLPSKNAVVTYLCIMGVLATLAVVVSLLLFVAYLVQLLIMSVGECVQAFNSLDPLVRVLFFALATVLVMWRASSMMKVKHEY